jgi:hypothetical protein
MPFYPTLRATWHHTEYPEAQAGNYSFEAIRTFRLGVAGNLIVFLHFVSAGATCNAAAGIGNKGYGKRKKNRNREHW